MGGYHVFFRYLPDLDLKRYGVDETGKVVHHLYGHFKPGVIYTADCGEEVVRAATRGDDGMDFCTACDYRMLEQAIRWEESIISDENERRAKRRRR